MDKEYHWLLTKNDNSYFGISIQKHTEATNFFRHCHDDYEIYYFEKGVGKFILEDTKISLYPGDLVFIRPLQYHYVETRSDCPYTRIVLNLSRKTLQSRQLLPFIDRLEKKPSPFFNLSQSPHLIQLLKKPIATDAIFSPEEQSEYIFGVIIQFLAELSIGDNPRTEQTSALSAITQRIIDYVNANIEKPLSVDSISTALYLSSSYTANRFLSEMHIGLMLFVRNKKMLYAKRLLESGCSPNEVSKRCGYQDYGTFYRTFKKINGINPSKFKNQDHR